MNASILSNIEGALSRSEMRMIKAGFGDHACHVYCCDNNGSCSSGTVNENVQGTTNEECQDSAISYGFTCPSGYYVAALYKSTEPEVA